MTQAVLLHPTCLSAPPQGGSSARPCVRKCVPTRTAPRLSAAGCGPGGPSVMPCCPQPVSTSPRHLGDPQQCPFPILGSWGTPCVLPVPPMTSPDSLRCHGLDTGVSMACQQVLALLTSICCPRTSLLSLSESPISYLLIGNNNNTKTIVWW